MSERKLELAERKIAELEAEVAEWRTRAEAAEKRRLKAARDAVVEAFGIEEWCGMCDEL